MAALIYLRSIDSILNTPFTFLLFAGVMINDSMAFIFGKAIGGPKILPIISPNKTYSGLLGGLLGSIVFITLCDMYFLNGFTNFYLSNADKIFESTFIHPEHSSSLDESCSIQEKVEQRIIHYINSL